MAGGALGEPTAIQRCPLLGRGDRGLVHVARCVWPGHAHLKPFVGEAQSYNDGRGGVIECREQMLNADLAAQAVQLVGFLAAYWRTGSSRRKRGASPGVSATANDLSTSPMRASSTSSRGRPAPNVADAKF